MQFKKWFYENLAGPGDGPDSNPLDLVRYHGDLAKKGAGAFPRTDGNPPKPMLTATAKYLDPAYRKNKKRLGF